MGSKGFWWALIKLKLNQTRRETLKRSFEMNFLDGISGFPGYANKVQASSDAEQTNHFSLTRFRAVVSRIERILGKERDAWNNCLKLVLRSGVWRKNRKGRKHEIEIYSGGRRRLIFCRGSIESAHAGFPKGHTKAAAELRVRSYAIKRAWKIGNKLRNMETDGLSFDSFKYSLVHAKA